MRSLHAIQPLIPEDFVLAAVGLRLYGYEFQYRVYNGQLQYRRANDYLPWQTLPGPGSWTRRGQEVVRGGRDTVSYQNALARFITE